MFKKSKAKSDVNSSAPKFVFVVGGVMSGVGKGVATSSLATIMKARGYKVTAVKIDPYINVDAGTMNPTVHGEVFVLDDGDETDQDKGSYERFLHQNLSSVSYMTTGRVYLSVIERERNLEYEGRDVEVIPDIPEEVIRRIKAAQAKTDADVTFVEIGGTIGEYQTSIFYEAVRMMKTNLEDDVALVMVSYLPTPKSVGEMKTKPTQYAARTLNSAGLQADIILARAETPIDDKRRDKIARFCNVKPNAVFSAPDVESIYDVPLSFEANGAGDLLGEILGLSKRTADLKRWSTFVDLTKNTTTTVSIAVVGKYFKSGDFILSDVYLSVLEALKFSGYHLGAKVIIDYLDAADFENKDNLSMLNNYDGVLIPGGFGKRGIEGKINVIEYVRTQKIPYFGLCYGMQLLCIEYARHVAGLTKAHTAEIDPQAPHVVIDIMPDQKERIANHEMGGTMRLGGYDCDLAPDTIAARAYNARQVRERHRHRYEVNPKYIQTLTQAGLVFSGTSPDGTLMEIAELPKSVHPFMVGTQFHPEFLARPLDPHPLFNAFIAAALEHQNR